MRDKKIINFREVKEEMRKQKADKLKGIPIEVILTKNLYDTNYITKEVYDKAIYSLSKKYGKDFRDI